LVPLTRIILGRSDVETDDLGVLVVFRKVMNQELAKAVRAAFNGHLLATAASSKIHGPHTRDQDNLLIPVEPVTLPVILGALAQEVVGPAGQTQVHEQLQAAQGGGVIDSITLTPLGIFGKQEEGHGEHWVEGGVQHQSLYDIERETCRRQSR
jgi:hypothetical protein